MIVHTRRTWPRLPTLTIHAASGDATPDQRRKRKRILQGRRWVTLRLRARPRLTVVLIARFVAVPTTLRIDVDVEAQKSPPEPYPLHEAVPSHDPAPAALAAASLATSRELLSFDWNARASFTKRQSLNGPATNTTRRAHKSGIGERGRPARIRERPRLELWHFEAAPWNIHRARVCKIGTARCVGAKLSTAARRRRCEGPGSASTESRSSASVRGAPGATHGTHFCDDISATCHTRHAAREVAPFEPQHAHSSGCAG